MMAGVEVKNPEGPVRNLEGGRVNEMAGDDPEGMVLKQVKLGEASACVVSDLTDFETSASILELGMEAGAGGEHDGEACVLRWMLTTVSKANTSRFGVQPSVITGTNVTNLIMKARFGARTRVHCTEKAVVNLSFTAPTNEN